MVVNEIQTGAEAGHQMTYQWMLRVLGAYLDEAPSCRITLVEQSDGFVIRLQRLLQKVDPVVIQLKHDEIHQQLDRLMQERKASRPTVRHPGVWARFPNGHQDFFRALGFELDRVSAQAVVIDELPDAVVLTYRTESSPQRYLTILAQNHIEYILNSTFERRQQASA